jgi:dihydrofolate synthase/folylpolyglutamate synthase
MHSTSYDQALAFWYGCINYEQIPAHPDDLKLDRMRTLLRALGDPQDRFRIVHVAGSKGKGSTSAMLAAVLGRAGYRAGLFTSPHLCGVEERVQVDGVPITPEELTAVLNQVRDAVRPNSATTFFEIATALGFLHFARRRVDVALVEVGLGGRFDSTNVCLPLVSLITSISFDHTRQLGNRLASIAFEKAGIVKPGRRVVSGATVPEAAQVIQDVCRQRHAPLRQLGVDFSYRYRPGKVTATETRRARVEVVTRRRTWPEMELSLLGEHQAANAAVAIGCIEELHDQGLSIPDAAVSGGLAGVDWPARLEVLGRRPLVVLDCAHNVASMHALVDALDASFPPGRRLLVLACSNDKDLAGILRVLTPHFAEVFLTCFRNNPRSARPEQLLELLRQSSDLPATVCPTSGEAWEKARAAARAEDLICVTGSVYLAGEVRPLLLSGQGQD